MKSRMIFGLLGLLALGTLLATGAQAQLKWSGYTQLRYNWWDDDLNKDDTSNFQVRRTRIKLDGPINEDTTFTLQADFSKLIDDEKGSGSVELKDALITRKLNKDWLATGGYTSVPFGYEVPLSDAVTWPLERSRAADVLFPGQRDTGLYVHYRPVSGKALQADLGYSNGLHNWYDKSSAGDRDVSSDAIIGRVQWPLPNSSFIGASYMMASRTRTIGGTDYDFDNQDVFGLHARYNFPCNFTAIAEYYDGHQPVLSGGLPVDQTVHGWYALAAYTMPNKPITPFYRYDTFDFAGTADYTRNVVGLAWDRTKTERFTFQVEDGNDGKGIDFTDFAVQWQVKY